MCDFIQVTLNKPLLDQSKDKLNDLNNYLGKIDITRLFIQALIDYEKKNGQCFELDLLVDENHQRCMMVCNSNTEAGNEIRIGNILDLLSRTDKFSISWECLPEEEEKRHNLDRIQIRHNLDRIQIVDLVLSFGYEDEVHKMKIKSIRYDKDHFRENTMAFHEFLRREYQDKYDGTILDNLIN